MEGGGQFPESYVQSVLLYNRGEGGCRDLERLERVSLV